MITMRRQLLGLGFVAASSLLALHAAQAMTGPTAIQIDGGPLGDLQFSGGVDGYGYFVTGTNSNYNGLISSNTPVGAEVGSALVELQKTDGVLQFTIEIGSNGGATTLGTAPSQTSITNLSTGPLYEGYLTLAPTGTPFTISAGVIPSLEGYESGVDWNNADQLTTLLFYVENGQNRGVNVNYTQGPVNATVAMTDGYDTGVFNFLQALVTYTFNPTNVLSVFYGGNLGSTGLAAHTYAGTGNYKDTSVENYGSQFDNSQMVGAYYSYTDGNLLLVPEVQFQFAKRNDNLDLGKSTYNLGAAVFGDYSFGTSPYSLGGWVEYFDSTASDYNYPSGNVWAGGQAAEAIGISLAPTWQYKDLFARANVGYLYLLNHKGPYEQYGYGSGNDGQNNFQGTLEAGLLF